ncbi:Protein Tob2 [Dirofilaria immitis]
MYTELKELINFLAIYMHYRIPRRRICLFMESYGNHLAGRFLEKWKPEEPKFGEKERTLMIKTRDCLDEIFTTIAASIGIVMEDLAACFPSPMLLCCNPGEVSCQVMNYAHIIIVWMGDVNADISYTPIPAGIAFFCETPGILYNVLNSNDNLLDKINYSFFFGSKNKEMKSQRCILLQLINCMDDSAYDLLGSGFFSENKIPPFLFRYTTRENCPFTARSFADTRFGSHRSRPDHKAMRRIQHAAAFLAMTNDNAGTATGNRQDCTQFAMNSTTDNFFYNQSYANNNFASVASPAVPLTSAAVAVSDGQRTCDALSSMAMSANAITKAVALNESKFLLMNSSSAPSNPSSESISSSAGRAASQLYPLSPIVETGSDFNSYNCHAVASDVKVDHAKVELSTCDERDNLHLTYPHSSRALVTDSYNPYAFEAARDNTDRSFLCRVNPNEMTSETPSFLSFPTSLSNISNRSSENPENQIYNLESNNLDIVDLQYNISRMSFADGMALASSTLATSQSKMN